MNNLFLISCLTLSISAVLGQGMDPKVMQTLQDLGKKINESISKQCMTDTNSGQIACNKIMLR